MYSKRMTLDGMGEPRIGFEKNQSRTRARDPSVEGVGGSGVIQIRSAYDWSLTPYGIYYSQFDDI